MDHIIEEQQNRQVNLFIFFFVTSLPTWYLLQNASIFVSQSHDAPTHVHGITLLLRMTQGRYFILIHENLTKSKTKESLQGIYCRA